MCKKCFYFSFSSLKWKENKSLMDIKLDFIWVEEMLRQIYVDHTKGKLFECALSSEQTWA